MTRKRFIIVLWAYRTKWQQIGKRVFRKDKKKKTTTSLTVLFRLENNIKKQQPNYFTLLLFIYLFFKYSIFKVPINS